MKKHLMTPTIQAALQRLEAGCARRGVSLLGFSVFEQFFDADDDGRTGYEDLHPGHRVEGVVEVNYYASDSDAIVVIDVPVFSDGHAMAGISVNDTPVYGTFCEPRWVSLHALSRSADKLITKIDETREN